MKTIMSMLCVILLNTLLFAQSVDEFIGKWNNISPDGNGCGGGCPTSLNIYKDGKLFIIDESRWSDGGRSGGIVNIAKAYKAKYKDGSLEISNQIGMTIDYGASSGHIFFKDQEFSKSNSKSIEIEKDMKLKNTSDVKDYKTVKIGTKIWMAENLNVGRFRNGDPIPEVKSHEEWIKAGKEGTPAWCYYENNSENGKKYGKLYNWYAVNDKRGLAPEGLHIPTQGELQSLAIAVNKNGNALKAIGQGMAKGAGTNTSGLSVLLAGYRYYTGDINTIDFHSLGGSTYFWSSTEYDAACALTLNLSLVDEGVSFDDRGGEKGSGYSVRCVKD